MSKTVNSNSQGFTLLEVVVAVAIIGASLAMLLGTVNKNLEIASKTRDSQIAANLAQRMLSQLELEGYPQVREDSGQFEDFPEFDWYITVIPYNISQLKTGIRIVRLLITWDEGNEDFEVWTAVAKN